MRVFQRDKRLVFRHIQVVFPIAILVLSFSYWFLPADKPADRTSELPSALFQTGQALGLFVFSAIGVHWAFSEFQWSVVKFGRESIEFRYFRYLVIYYGTLPLADVDNVDFVGPWRRRRSLFRRTRRRYSRFVVTRRGGRDDVLIHGFSTTRKQYFEIKDRVQQFCLNNGMPGVIPQASEASRLESTWRRG
ncbi:hypothetical protein [Rubinisphaera sp. JC750]|uniref:hypothetical protein n=1 Tax=Rubinisphaera sp. JC750 TaxID=2898658 RepID=UPI001F255DDF|nr:hypothetical protein [Rubinisphaera sp. JC750]